jgi:hypothetical protein
MTDFSGDLDAALEGSEPVARVDVLRWIEKATDLPTLSKLYRVTGEHYYRIHPELGKDAACTAIQRYLLECIRQNVQGNEQIKDRREAAETLHLWFRQLVEMGDATDVLGRAAQAIRELFLNSDVEIRAAIEHGFLARALESVSVRPFFESWSSDLRLRETWGRALEWQSASRPQPGARSSEYEKSKIGIVDEIRA